MPSTRERFLLFVLVTTFVRFIFFFFFISFLLSENVTLSSFQLASLAVFSSVPLITVISSRILTPVFISFLFLLFFFRDELPWRHGLIISFVYTCSFFHTSLLLYLNFFPAFQVILICLIFYRSFMIYVLLAIFVIFFFFFLIFILFFILLFYFYFFGTVVID